MSSPKHSPAVVLPLSSAYSVAAPLNVRLRPYQRQGVRFLFRQCFVRQSGALLADDMGLGKTVQVIALLSALLGKTHVREEDVSRCRRVKFQSGTQRVFLIVAPASVMLNWAQELDSWGWFVHANFHRDSRLDTLTRARLGKLEVVLTTFETARDAVDDLNRVDWTAVIVDEVHRLKDDKARVTKALKSLACRVRIGLTGTLLQNKYSDLWCVLDWANPNCLGSKQSFLHKFSSKIERGLRIDALKGELSRARDLQQKLDDLKSQWVLRRTKDNTIADQLPKKTDQVVMCQMSRFQLKVFASMLESEDMRTVLDGLEACPCGRGRGRSRRLCCDKRLHGQVSPDQADWRSLVFKYLHLFQKAANHVALLLPQHTRSELQADEGERICRVALRCCPELAKSRSSSSSSFLTLSDPKYSGKMEVLAQLLTALHEEEEKAKVLLFSRSTVLLDILEAFVQSKGYDYRRLDGKTRPESRLDLVTEFNTNADLFLFLISTKAGGLGLNITGANVVVVFDPNWNPSHDLQAQDRAYRIGQTRDVRVFRLISAGSIEENMYLRQLYKQQLGKNAVDGEKARRYFQAVKGLDQGELFGLKNMFSVRTGKNTVTSDILNRNKTHEDAVRRQGDDAINRIEGKRFEIHDNELELRPCEDGDKSAYKTGEDPDKSNLDFKELCDQDAVSDDDGNDDDDNDDSKPQEDDSSDSDSSHVISQWQKKKAQSGSVRANQKTVTQILSSSQVLHKHLNQDLVGGSRVEDHISECARKSVREDGSTGSRSAQEPVLLNCETIAPTQVAQQLEEKEAGLEELEPEPDLMEPDELEEFRGRKKTALLRANEERLFKTDTGLLFYGQTPSARRRLDFERLADYLNLSVEETARDVLGMSTSDRAELLQEFYDSLNVDGSRELFDEVRAMVAEEEGELADLERKLSDGGFLEDDRTSKDRRMAPKSGRRRTVRAVSAVSDFKDEDEGGSGQKQEEEEGTNSENREQSGKSGKEGNRKNVCAKRVKKCKALVSERNVEERGCENLSNSADSGEEIASGTVTGEEEFRTAETLRLRPRSPKPAPDETYRRRRNSGLKSSSSQSASNSAAQNSNSFYKSILAAPSRKRVSKNSELDFPEGESATSGQSTSSFYESLLKSPMKRKIDDEMDDLSPERDVAKRTPKPAPEESYSKCRKVALPASDLSDADFYKNVIKSKGADRSKSADDQEMRVSSAVKMHPRRNIEVDASESDQVVCAEEKDDSISLLMKIGKIRKLKR